MAQSARAQDPVAAREARDGIGSSEGVTTDPAARTYAHPAYRRTAYGVCEVCPAASVGRRVMLGQVRSASWRVTPANESDAAMRAADEVRQALGIDGMPRPVFDTRAGDGSIRRITLDPWDRVIARIAHGALVGYSVQEMVSYVATDGRTYVSLEPRHWASIVDWARDRSGRITHAVQSAPVGRMGAPRIPVDRCVIHVYPGPDHGPWGDGLYRPVAPLSADLRAMGAHRMTAAQRYAMPLPALRLDESAYRDAHGSSVDESTWETIRDEAIDALAQVRAHESAAIVMRGYWGQAEAMPLTDPSRFDGAIDHIWTEILRLFYAQHVMLGSSSSSGAYSTSQTHAELAVQMHSAILDWIAEGLGPLVREAVALRLGDIPIEDMPRITHHGLQAPLWLDHVASLPALTSAGILTPSPGDEAAIRQALEMPTTSDRAAARGERERVAGLVARDTPTLPTEPA